MESYLKPIFDSRQSFYLKATIIQENNIIKLKSYNTIVATIKDDKATISGIYSATTTRHQKEFLKQNNFKVTSTEQLIKTI